MQQECKNEQRTRNSEKAADAEVRRSLFSSPMIRQYGGIVISLVVLCVVFAVLNPRFLTFNNFMNIMQQVAVIAVAAYGMTYVILLGEIDLSIGSIIAVSGMVAAQAFAMGFGFAPTVIFTLAAGAIMGGRWCPLGQAYVAVLHRHRRNYGHLSRHGQSAYQWRT